MNDNKKKMILSVVIFLLGLIANIFFSTAMHYIFTGQMKTLKLIALSECLFSIFSNKNHLMLFLCLQGMIATLSGFFYFANNKPYQSKLITISDLIKIPVPAGQYQHGSARFLEAKEKEKVFASFEILKSDMLVKKLLDEGFADIEKQEKEEQAKGKPITSKPIINDENEIITCGVCPVTRGDDESEGEGKEKPLPQKTNVDENLYIKKGGVAIGIRENSENEKLYFIGEDSHTLCIGATRSGKSRTIVLQTICTLGLAGESMILSDPKGELYVYTYPFLERLGYEVIAIDFKNPLKSTRYNFLQPVIDCINNDNLPRAIEKTWDITNTTQSSQSFPTTYSYNDGSYSGTINQSGSANLVSGLPLDSKTATYDYYYKYNATATITSIQVNPI